MTEEYLNDRNLLFMVIKLHKQRKTYIKFKELILFQNKNKSKNPNVSLT